MEVEDIEYFPKAESDLVFWRSSGNKGVLKRIAKLTEAIFENPYEGIGKPEQLKYEMAGVWSRRITDEHRYVYEIIDNKLIVHSLKGHYE
jgi:toxin YoeB